MNTQTSQRLNVVHSSFGRVRVHLPDPEGVAVSRVRRLPGVTFASSSKWTGNILVLFSPRALSEKDVLAAMLSVAGVPVVEETPVRKMAETLAPAPDSRQPVAFVSGWRRTTYRVLGWVSVGLGAVGLAVPGIPGAPFVVLAGYFFIRSSPQAHAWLLRSRWFGPILRDWEQQRGVRRSLKYALVGLIAVAIVALLASGLPTALIATVLAFEVILLIIVLRLRVVEPTPSLPALNMG
jgi:uncharacterized membrane protein YbaN (DUF454 family)